MAIQSERQQQLDEVLEQPEGIIHDISEMDPPPVFDFSWFSGIEDGQVTYVMYQQCTWCAAMIRGVRCEKSSAGSVSHGICREDADRLLAEMRGGVLSHA